MGTRAEDKAFQNSMYGAYVSIGDVTPGSTMKILTMAFCPEVLRAMRHVGCVDMAEDQLLNEVGKYIIDYCTTLRADLQAPELADYVPQYSSSLVETLTIENAIRWYAPSLLSELEILGITRPYLINIDTQIITIGNKKEYS